MDLELKDQVAVVVGGAQGIGRAIADAFVKEGSRVGIVDCASEVDGFSGEFRQAGPGSARPMLCRAQKKRASTRPIFRQRKPGF